MSYPLVPPPTNDTGAFTVPRMLMRWLDVNPATKLTRTQAYIVLPVFSVNQTWLGYSDIVASFNYEGPNNFTLSGFNIEPLPIPNYCLCISWRVQGVMYRYSLWRGVGEVFYFDVQPYAGQKIGKNFRFEIWSTSSSPSVQALPLTIYTSVSGGIDYRWGTDFVLIGNDPINTSFADNINIVPTPAGLLVQFIGDSGVVGANWQASFDSFNSPSNKIMYSGNLVIASADNRIADHEYVINPPQLPSPYWSNLSTVLSSRTLVAILFNPQSFADGAEVFAASTHTNAIIDYALCQTASGTFYFAHAGTQVGLNTGIFTANQWLLALIDYDYVAGAVALVVYPFSQILTAPTFAGYTGGGVYAIPTNINALGTSYLGSSSNTNYAAIAAFNRNVTGEQPIINYMWELYQNTFNLPLTFPAMSVSTTN